MIRWLGKSVIQTPQNLLVPVDAARQEVSSRSLYNWRCPITDPFLLVWGIIWTIQAVIFFALGIIVGILAFKVSHLLILSFSCFAEKLNFFSFIRKMLNNKQVMHQISFLFQDPRVAHSLWNQVFWFYYLHSRCCSLPWEHCKICLYSISRPLLR